jgi:hypothetical protein
VIIQVFMEGIVLSFVYVGACLVFFSVSRAQALSLVFPVFCVSPRGRSFGFAQCTVPMLSLFVHRFEFRGGCFFLRFGVSVVARAQRFPQNAAFPLFLLLLFCRGGVP